MLKEGIVESDVLWGVNVVKDKAHMTDLERQHMPVIEAPPKVYKHEHFEVKVDVGNLLEHPNEPAHFIEWIELYIGDTFVGRENYSGGISYPEALFKLKMDHAKGPLKAWAKCNLHGLWTAEKEIEIIDIG
jgi:superoxide reductase